MQTLTLRRPDDFHLHLRDGNFLQRTVHDVSKQFARALVMPNLENPVTDVEIAQQYRQRIISAIPHKNIFTPLMTLYLTDNTDESTIIRAKKSEIIFACKLYPAGVTTHSTAGVQDIKKLYPVFQVMQSEGLVLCIHGETLAASVDIFDREKIFIEKELIPLIDSFPHLRIVLEHISTEFAVNFVKQAPANVAATITPHHLLINRNDLLADGIKPHYYCKPIVKAAHDQQALIAAAISGDPKFFLGTDSAPHAKSKKESDCGCAGIYSSHAALELYAHVFETHNHLHRLESFTSEFGADFYHLPRNTSTITLHREAWEIPARLPYGDDILIPFYASQTLNWKVIATHE